MEIRTDLTNEQYHAHPAISHSMIMSFLKSPAKCWYNYIRDNAADFREETEAMRFGTAVHTAILEPKEFEAQYTQFVKLSGTGSVVINKLAMEEIKRSGKTIISDQDQAIIDLMKTNFGQCGYAKECLDKSTIEGSVFWKDAESGVDLKCRPDFFTENVAFDLKTSGNVDPYDFGKSVYDYGYHVQAAMNLDGLTAVTGREYSAFVILAFEKTKPYPLVAYVIDDEAIAIGRSQYKEAAKKIAEYNENKIMWHVPREIGLPRWAVEKLQGELDYVG